MDLAETALKGKEHSFGVSTGQDYALHHSFLL